MKKQVLKQLAETGNVPTFSVVLDNLGRFMFIVNDPDNTGDSFFVEIQDTSHTGNNETCITTIDDLEYLAENLLKWVKTLKANI